jgi:hypothetical protein
VSYLRVCKYMDWVCGYGYMRAVHQVDRDIEMTGSPKKNKSKNQKKNHKQEKTYKNQNKQQKQKSILAVSIYLVVAPIKYYYGV